MANTPLRLIPASELASLPPTERLGLTKFVARGLNVIYGPSGCYKSFYTLDAALRIAQFQPIIYVAAEGTGGLHKRVTAWSEYNGRSAGHAYFIDREVNLLNNEDIKSFCRIAHAVKPVLIVLDTLARCIPGADENSAKDMGLAIRSSYFIQYELKSAVTLVHHTDKGQRWERGSGAIRGASDLMIEIFPNGDGSIRVSCSKDKDDQHFPDEQLSFTPVLNSGVLVPTTGYAVLKYSDLEIRILDFLSLETFKTAGARTFQIMNALNIPERTIYRLLSHLKTDCQIDQDKKGDPYRLTDDGKETLRHATAISRDTTELEQEQ